MAIPAPFIEAVIVIFVLATRNRLTVMRNIGAETSVLFLQLNHSGRIDSQRRLL